MPNTRSAEKAARQSKKRAIENLFWNQKIKAHTKSLKTGGVAPDILGEQYSEFQSVLDKAVKNKVIHKNKAARLKSRIFKSAHATSPRPNKRKSKSG